jgi:hypothetical protein
MPSRSRSRLAVACPLRPRCRMLRAALACKMIRLLLQGAGDKGQARTVQ